VLLAHADVVECAVVGVPDVRLGQVPEAVVVRRGGSAISSESLMRFALDRLASFKVPRRITFRESPLPRTATGKILRAEVVQERNGE
jgi:fatty-acyl-CoA synthase